MSRLEHQAEILKLGRFLDVEPEALDMLTPVDAASIRRLREQATRHFFASDAAFFKRIVQASRLLPVPLLALVAEKVLGPMLSARVAGQMDVDRGVGIAKRLETRFLADTCLSLDPHSTRELIAAMPVTRIVDVGVELSEREEFVTMARFVDIISDDAIRSVLAKLDDNAALLHTAFLVEDKPRLDRIVAALSEERIVSVIRTAASEADLWPETLGLMEHLGDEWKQKLGDLAASLEVEVLESMVHSVRANGLWSVALPLVGYMSPDSQARFANLQAVQDEAALKEILYAADAEQLWPSLLPVVHRMEEDGLQRAAAVAEVLDGEQMLRVADAASSHGQWPALLSLVRHMSDAQRDTVMGLVSMAPERMLRTLMPALEAEDAWPLLREALPGLGTGPRQRVLQAAEAAGLAERLADGGR